MFTDHVFLWMKGSNQSREYMAKCNPCQFRHDLVQSCNPLLIVPMSPKVHFSTVMQKYDYHLYDAMFRESQNFELQNVYPNYAKAKIIDQ